tara:strand:- start:44 stop:451 length:408 start_codon:yes stop_codon:yes gene_type:complete
MANKKTRVYNKNNLGKMTTEEIKKRALSEDKWAKEFLKKRGMTTKISDGKKYARPKPKTATKIFKKAVAKKTIGKSIAKKIPYVGAAIIARDVIKGVSKATCGKRGGKWVSGKCVGTKKAKFKKGSPVKDPISKR